MFDQAQQLHRINRLEQKIHHAQMHRRDGVLHIGIAGNNDDRQRRPHRFAYLADQVQAIDVAHAQIRDHQANRGFFREHLQCGFTAGRSHATNTVQRENLRQQLPGVLVVIDDQYTLRRQVGFEHYSAERFTLGVAQNIVVGHGILYVFNSVTWHSRQTSLSRASMCTSSDFFPSGWRRNFRLFL
ncbi:hypothetical protein EMIT093MI4_150002 [Pseudomonas sp. IT-93MI4]